MTEPPEDNDGGTSYGLLVPFLERDKRYALGVEYGMLHERMRNESEVTGYFTLDNQEQITLAANRLGWTIRSMEPWGGGDWFWLEMEKPE